MGMDGISIANTGAVKESTSAEYSSKTEQAVNADPVISDRQVQGTLSNQRVRAKDEEEDASKEKKRNQQQLQEEKNNDTFEDGLVEEKPEEISNADLAIEDLENPNKDFYVKLNVKDDIIELYDSATNRLIESISGSELGELVQKLNMASGIFVNKKV